MKKKITLLLLAVILFSATPVLAKAWDYKYPFYYDGTGSTTHYDGKDTPVVFVEAKDPHGNSITRVGQSLFLNNTDIEVVYIDAGIEVVEDSAFYNSHIQELYFPESLMKIGDKAMGSCAKLEKITFLNEIPPVFGKDILKNTGEITIFLPSNVNLNDWYDAIYKVKGDYLFNLENVMVKSIHDDISGEQIEFWDIDYEALEKYGDTFESTYGSLTIETLEEIGYISPIMPFKDVSRGDWFYSNLKYAYALEIIKGKSETSFAPNDTLTMAEAAKIASICHMLKNERFESLDEGGKTWYDEYIKYCYRNRIVPESFVFEPNRPATRGELAFIFSNIDKKANEINEVPLTDIPDVNENTEYHKEILKMYNVGIMVGSDDNYTFHPNQNIKRSEVTALISRLLNFNYRIELPKG